MTDRQLTVDRTVDRIVDRQTVTGDDAIDLFGDR